MKEKVVYWITGSQTLYGADVLEHVAQHSEEMANYVDKKMPVTVKYLTTCKSSDEIVAAAKYYDPARMTRYAMDVAALYHKFYQNCRVKCEDHAVCAARAALCRATATVLENTLGMLKITAPEVM